jgi:hypothetical protein
MLIPILANDVLGPFFPPASSGTIPWPSPMVKSAYKRGTAACFLLVLLLVLSSAVF